MRKYGISMDELQRNLTKIQLGSDNKPQYAVFLPATSGFYATFIGRQRYKNYVDPARIPASYANGIESLNYLSSTKGQFYYKWNLYSAGHANLDMSKVDEGEDMFRNRNRSDSFTLGDSGGFQIGKFQWPADWKNPACPAAAKKRKQVLEWMDAYMDYGMCLDIPAWVAKNPGSEAATGIRTYADAVAGTIINNDYFINNRKGTCKILNVMQGENHSDADGWYQTMKKYCDPKQYGDRAFNGWAMGGQLMCSPTLVLKTIVKMRGDQLLEKGQHDWMHFLGTSKLEWAVFLTAIQRAVRKYYNEDFTISFDCASPFLATANGQIYTNVELEDRKKWVYRMIKSADDKKYALDTRLFKDVVIQDKIFKRFESSPMIDDLKINEICIYKPGVPNPAIPASVELDPLDPTHWLVMPDQNKIGKVGRTSWDSFSYAIQMGHNVWAHINAVQRANQAYDSKKAAPAMLVDSRHEIIHVDDVIDEIFAANTEDAYKIIKKYDRFLTGILGTRGNTGKRETSTQTYFNSLFEFTDEAVHSDEFTADEEAALDQLENEVKEN